MNNSTIHLEIFLLVLIWHYSCCCDMSTIKSSINYSLEVYIFNKNDFHENQTSSCLENCM